MSKSVKRIAVIGPNADNRIAVLGNYNGTPSKVLSLLDGLKRILAIVQKLSMKAINFTNDTLMVYDDVSSRYSIDGKPGIRASILPMKKWRVPRLILPLKKISTIIRAEGQTPAPNVGSIHYSARFTTNLAAAKD